MQPVLREVLNHINSSNLIIKSTKLKFNYMVADVVVSCNSDTLYATGVDESWNLKSSQFNASSKNCFLGKAIIFVISSTKDVLCWPKIFHK